MDESAVGVTDQMIAVLQTRTDAGVATLTMLHEPEERILVIDRLHIP